MHIGLVVNDVCQGNVAMSDTILDTNDVRRVTTATSHEENDVSNLTEICVQSTEMTCEALCSLSASPPPASTASTSSTEEKAARRPSKGCPKQHQLPMFLSSEYSIDIVYTLTSMTCDK